MQSFHSKDGIKTTFHAGATEERIVLTLAVTNNRNEEWSTESGNAAWCSIGLVDSEGTPRLEGMGSAAVVTPWTIPAGETLVRQRETQTRAEASEIDFDWADTILDPEDYREQEANDNSEEARPYFVHNVALPEESDEEFTAHAQVKLSGYSPKLSLTFTPSQLNEPLDTEEEFDVADDPRGGMF